MKLLTANRLDDGRVIYWAEGGETTCVLREAARLDDVMAEAALTQARSRPEVFVNPYLVEAIDGVPSGRDRLKETIRATGPTVGNSLPHPASAGAG
jgi:hypothetical protein